MKTYTAKNFFFSLRASLYKEWYDIRASHRLLMIAIGFMAFALLDPLMAKLMPILLKDQLKGVDLSALINSSQSAAIAMFVGDLQELAQLVLILVLMGVISQERLEKRLVIPVSMGLDLRAAYLAKWLVYTLIILLVVPLALGTAALYGGMLFGFEPLPGPSLMAMGTAISLYFSAVVALVLALGERFKRPIAAGVSAIFAVYGLSAIIGIWEAAKPWLPGKLIAYAALGDKTTEFPWEAALCAVAIVGLSLMSLLVRKDYVAKSIR